MLELKMVRKFIGVLLFVYLSSAREIVYRKSSKMKDTGGDLLQQQENILRRQLSEKRLPKDSISSREDLLQQQEDILRRQLSGKPMHKDSIASFLDELKDTTIVEDLLTGEKTLADDSRAPSSFGKQYYGRRKDSGLQRRVAAASGPGDGKHWGRRKDGESQRRTKDLSGPPSGSSFGKEYWGRRKDSNSQRKVLGTDDMSSEKYNGKYFPKWVKTEDANSENKQRKGSEDTSSEKYNGKHFPKWVKTEDAKSEEQKWKDMSSRKQNFLWPLTSSHTDEEKREEQMKDDAALLQKLSGERNKAMESRGVDSMLISEDQLADERLWKKYFLLRDNVDSIKSDNQRRMP